MKSKTKNKASFPWFVVALALLPANFYLLYTNANLRPSGVVAQMSGHQLHRTELPQAVLDTMHDAQSVSYAALEHSVKEWASQIALEDEAKRTRSTVDQLLQQRGMPKNPVTDAQVTERYRRSPAADLRPYPGVLDEIKQALVFENTEAARREYVDSLLEKEGLEILTPKPEEYQPPSLPLQYAVYVPPPVLELENGRVVGPPSKGAADAPVVLEIYSDFMCPFSRQFKATMNGLLKEYPGRVRAVFHQFPLPMHPGADKLAEASVCAQEQGKFWEMHDMLMEWEGQADPGKLTAAAQNIGIEPKAFSACLADGRYADFVKRSIRDASNNGVYSTPTFSLNGRRAVGAIPFDALKPAVEWFENPKGIYPGRSMNPANRPSPEAQQVIGKPVDLPKEALTTGPSRGPADAPVTVVEFVDFNCPFCQKGAQIVDPILKASKTPVRFFSKQLPLQMHPNAQSAAVAALCAHEQGKYWQFRDEVFGEFWGKQAPEDLKAAAAKAGVDKKKFDACYDGSKTLDLVKKDQELAASVGARGTPTYLINGRPVVGANEGVIKQFIEEASAPKK